MDGRIYHLVSRLTGSLDHAWSIQEMADAVELSVPHLRKLFKRNLGISPMAYLRERRLERACECLENSFHQLKQIGSQVGITDCSRLSHDFKSRFGVSPTEYRRRYWDQMQSGTLPISEMIVLYKN